MWIEQVLGNLGQTAPDPAINFDYVDLAWHQCAQVLKTRSRQGEEIRVLLPRGQRLSHGDILYQDATRVITVNVTPCEVIVANPTTPRALALLALELGNLHWPTQVLESELVFPEDERVMAVVTTLAVPWALAVRRFLPTPAQPGPTVNVANGFRLIRGKITLAAAKPLV